MNRRAPLLWITLSTLTLTPSAIQAQTIPAGAPSAAQQTSTNALGDESPSLAALRALQMENDVRARDVAATTVAEAATRDGTPLAADTLPPELAARLMMPDVPVRMSPRLVRTLAMFRTDARARRLLASWVRKSNRYRHRIQQILLAEGLPASLVWVAGAESAFDPRAESSVGAAGLWQFMPDAGRSYGLRIDSWVDERRDPDRATRAGARYLRDLRTRFGTWELAFAAYNMGYNALLRSIRKYNTNDFETLASLEAGLPLETIHYVPRIMAFAIASLNPSVFELNDLRPDPVVAWEDVNVSASVSLAEIARESGVPEDELRTLNPALLRARTPPCERDACFVLHVPRGRSEAVSAALTRTRNDAMRAYVLRQGESLDEVAARWGLRSAQLLNTSGITDANAVRPGTVVLVPVRDPSPPPHLVRPVVAVDPTAEAGVAGTTRVFVRVTYSDTVDALALALRVSVADLVRWNRFDPRARLQSGMWVQAYVGSTSELAARVWRDDELEVVHRGSETFHDRVVADTGMVRLRTTVREGDTLDAIARRFHVTPGRIARINQLERSAPLTPGTVLVVYTSPSHASVEAEATTTTASDAPSNTN